MLLCGRVESPTSARRQRRQRVLAEVAQAHHVVAGFGVDARADRGLPQAFDARQRPERRRAFCVLWRQGRVTGSRSGRIHRCRKSPLASTPSGSTVASSRWDVRPGANRRRYRSPRRTSESCKGLWTRLDSHASGRRSGDQFCVYVCDRFVVARLSDQQQAQIGDGLLSLDTLNSFLISNTCDPRPYWPSVILNSSAPTES